MNVEQLIRMANQIGQFYEAYPNRVEALAAATDHLRRSWDPRMRIALLRHLDEKGGEGLDPFMAEAVRTHRDKLMPAERAALS